MSDLRNGSSSVAITLDWVREQKALHKAGIREHEAALADLEATERVLMKAAVSAAERRDANAPDILPTPLPLLANGSAGAVEKPGIKRTLLQVIANSPTGLTTQAAIAAAAKHGLEGLWTGNVSPKLSDAGKKRLLRLDHGTWLITEKGREYLAPEKE